MCAPSQQGRVVNSTSLTREGKGKGEGKEKRKEEGKGIGKEEIKELKEKPIIP